MTQGQEMKMRAFTEQFLHGHYARRLWRHGAVLAIVVLAAACSADPPSTTALSTETSATTPSTSTPTSAASTTSPTTTPTTAVPTTTATTIAVSAGTNISIPINAEILATHGSVVWAWSGRMLYAIDTNTVRILGEIDWAEQFCGDLWPGVVDLGADLDLFSGVPACDPDDVGANSMVAYRLGDTEVATIFPNTANGSFVVTVAMRPTGELAVTSAVPHPHPEGLIAGDNSLHVVFQGGSNDAIDVVVETYSADMLLGLEPVTAARIADVTRRAVLDTGNAMGFAPGRAGTFVPSSSNLVAGTIWGSGAVVTIDEAGQPTVHFVEGIANLFGETAFLHLAQYQGEDHLFLSFMHGGLCDKVEYFAIEPGSFDVVNSWTQDGFCPGTVLSAGTSTYLMLSDGTSIFTLSPDGGQVGGGLSLGDSHRTLIQLGDTVFIGAPGGASLIDESGGRLGCPIGGIDRSPALVAANGVVFVATGALTAFDPALCR